MSDITTIFGILIILGLGLPALMMAWWLLFPGRVAVAHQRVLRTPWKTLAMGVAGVFGWTIPIFILFALPGGPTQMLGILGILFALTFATLGAAGIASLMAERLSVHSSSDLSTAAVFLRGALALELAAAVPVLGWFVVVPVALVFSMGAAVFGLLGWGTAGGTAGREEKDELGGPAVPVRSAQSTIRPFADSPPA